jgi:hypothetical protein
MQNKNTKLLFESWRAFLKEEETIVKPPAAGQKPNVAKGDQNSIAAKLTAAFKAGPAATRVFLNSEEGKSEECRALLASGGAGKNVGDTVKVEGPTDISVAGKIPTQNFIDMMQSISFPLGSYESLIKTLNAKKGFGTIVVDKNLIIDGHHRWSGIFAFYPDGTINAINVSWPGQNTQEKLAAAQLTIAAKLGAGKEMPTATGEPATNILGKSAIEIAKMALQNVNKQTDPKAPGALMNDEMMNKIIKNKDGDAAIVYEWAGLDKSVTDIKKLRQAIAIKVGKNLKQIKSNPQAPERADMPQFDPKRGGPDFSDVVPDLKTGKYNVAPPFAESLLRKQIKKIVLEEIKRKK